MDSCLLGEFGVNCHCPEGPENGEHQTSRAIFRPGLSWGGLVGGVILTTTVRISKGRPLLDHYRSICVRSIFASPVVLLCFALLSSISPLPSPIDRDPNGFYTHPNPTRSYQVYIMPMTPRPNLGPLTTTFTAPKRCAKAVLAPTAPPLPPPPPPGGRGGARLAQTCYKDHAMDDAACWPSPNKGAATPAAAALGGWGVYTPGLVCPDSYTTACSATAGVKGGFDFQFGLEAGETAVGCCPR